MLQNTINIFASAIHEEMKDLVAAYNGKEDEKSKELKRVNNEGQVLIPVNVNPMNYAYEMDSYDTSDGVHEEYYGKIYDRIKYSNILKLDGNIDILKDILIDLFVNKDSSIYGILVIQGNERYNIMHPIIAKMISTGEIKLKETFKIVVYSYVDRYKLRDASTLDSNVERIVDITNMIQSNGYKAKGAIIYENNVNIEEASRQELYNDATFAFSMEGGARPEYGIAPVQLMSAEIAIPYYGIIGSKTDGGEYYSVDLAPMMSGNLDRYIGGSTEWWNTCTGDESNRYFKSLFVMNNMNLNSLYYESILDGDFRQWVFDCQMFSIYLMFPDEVQEAEKVYATTEKVEEKVKEVKIVKKKKSKKEIQELSEALDTLGF